jgi:transcriptional regulator with XRE-family HTH domain
MASQIAGREPHRGAAATQQLLDAFAKQIRALRQRRGLSQQEFATRCGISVSFASLLERGGRSPSYETLVHIAQALRIPLADLFGRLHGGNGEEPAYERLVEFARGRRLSRVQVDRLIKIGYAMFDEEVVESPAPQKQAAAVATCSYESCGGSVLAKGLCASHYHRVRRARQ